MVNLTKCAVCGRVIPATKEGCAYCERERDPQAERPYVALSVRMLLALFVLNLVVIGVWSGVHLVELWGSTETSPLPAVPSLARLLLSVGALFGLLSQSRWGWYLTVAFVVGEILGGALSMFGVLSTMVWAGPLFASMGSVPALAWWGPFLASLWMVLFLIVLLRPDVRARFDQRVADRHEVLDLIDSLTVGERQH